MNPRHSYAVVDHKYKLFPNHTSFCKRQAFYLYVHPYCSKLREPNPFQMQTFLEIPTTIEKARNKAEEGLGNL